MSRLKWAVFFVAIFMLSVSPLDAATSGTVSVKLSDIPVGKVIQVGQVKFVKVGADQYLAINLCPDGSTYSSFYKGCVVKTTTYSYTGNYQTFTAPATGTYVVELWGAQGGCWQGTSCGYYGGYVSGNIALSTSRTLYIYVGQGKASPNTAAFNVSTGSSGNGNPGGGATDVRLTNGQWNNNLSLNSRIIVAAGGGAPIQSVQSGGHAGGLIGYQVTNSKTGGTQVSPGPTIDYSCANSDTKAKFGIAAACGATGGGGYYAGSGGAHSTGGGAGGSSYISGHKGCVAIAEGSTTEPRAVRKSGCTTGTSDIECSYHYSGLVFTNTVMIDGAGYAWTNVKGSLQQMPSPASVGAYYASGVGHTGHGAARITQLSVYLGI